MKSKEAFITRYNLTHKVPFAQLDSITQARLLRLNYYHEEDRTPLRKSFDNAGVSISAVCGLTLIGILALVCLFKK